MKEYNENVYLQISFPKRVYQSQTKLRILL